MYTKIEIIFNSVERTLETPGTKVKFVTGSS